MEWWSLSATVVSTLLATQLHMIGFRFEPTAGSLLGKHRLVNNDGCPEGNTNLWIDADCVCSLHRIPVNHSSVSQAASRSNICPRLTESLEWPNTNTFSVLILPACSCSECSRKSPAQRRFSRSDELNLEYLEYLRGLYDQ